MAKDMLKIDNKIAQVLRNSSFTLPDTDSDPNPGTDIRPKMDKVMMGHLSPDRDPNMSPCNVTCSA